jgi:cell division protein FtsB
MGSQDLKLKVIERLKDKLKTYSNYLLIFLFLLMFISLIRNILRVVESNKRIEKAQNRVEKLKKENEELEENLAITKSEEFIERQLRDKLGLAKEGEIVIVLPDEKILETLAPSLEEEEETLPDPNWKKWLKMFY